jgi:hypothetical protein
MPGTLESSGNTEIAELKGNTMAKRQNPFELKSGGGALKKVVSVLIVLAALWLVVKFPGEAATTVKHTSNAAMATINGIGTFLRDVIG